MPEYLSPGVYVEEVEIGARPIEGVSTSTAGFLGEAERGPEEPRLIIGFEQFRRIYGTYLPDKYLAYAVDGFFTNGGKRCFVGRIVHGDASPTFGTIQPIKIEAVGPGVWGDRIAIRVDPGSLDDPNLRRFKLTVLYWNEQPLTPLVDPTDPANATNPNRRDPDLIEVYDDLVDVQTYTDYYETRINDISSLIRVTRQNPGVPNKVGLKFLFEFGGTKGKAGGNVDVGDFDGRSFKLDDRLIRTGFKGFAEIDEIAIVSAPDHHAVGGLTSRIIQHCTQLADRFAVLHSNPASDTITNPTNVNVPEDTRYAAFYFPWIKVYDPKTKRDKLVPPSGHVVGIYAKTDIERGVHKAPANEVVRGATDLQFQITKGEQDILNPKGVNCVRAFPGRGILLWGARTCSKNTLWKYVSVRRLFLFLAESIDEGTQWVVFEPNDEKLWARVNRTLTQFLTRVWRDGALMGTKPEEAFFVKVDRTTMTQDDIDNGRLIVLIGIAPVKPAEFVIFRIAQFPGGSQVTEV